MIYVGDGVWKSRAEAKVTALAERFGATVASGFGDLRGVPIKHRQHCVRFDLAAAAINPDLILSIGSRHSGAGVNDDYSAFASAKKVIAIGPDIENLDMRLPWPFRRSEARAGGYIVANAFGLADGDMKKSGEYTGVALEGMDPAKIAEGFGMEAMNVQDESKVGEAITQGLKIVEDEKRPYLLNVHMPQGLPAGGYPAKPFRLAEA